MTANLRTEIQRTRVRTKVNVEVEIIMSDGTRLTGMVYISLEERVLDLLNDPKSFFPLRLETDEILLINKASIALCKPLDTPG